MVRMKEHEQNSDNPLISICWLRPKINRAIQPLNVCKMVGYSLNHKKSTTNTPLYYQQWHLYGQLIRIADKYLSSTSDIWYVLMFDWLFLLFQYFVIYQFSVNSSMNIKKEIKTICSRYLFLTQSYIILQTTTSNRYAELYFNII